jgi:diaminohydroxyphosphoribosylaminopyrimidine deaminase / 5-amino-6-(5-phosphoribosylamino)uracil reductase
VLDIRRRTSRRRPLDKTAIRPPPSALTEERCAVLLRELGEEARRFRFEVAPNPCVGAAVISGDRVIARGFHEVWGQAHAEVRALDAARKSGVPASRWDALIITLEPCTSRGKTAPCVEAVLASGVPRVIVGEVDPDPRHRGSGLSALREAGIDVLLLEDAAPLRKVAPHFLAWTSNERLRRPRPWTIAKWAQTRTGQLTPPPEVGGGRWISGPESQREVQVVRSRVDAIVTGVGTVLRDNPRLTVRPPGDVSHPPLRVILDSRLRTPPTSALLRPPEIGEGGGEVHILCVGGNDEGRHRALVEAGAIVHELHVATDDGVSLRDAHSWMWDRGIRRASLEAGPRLLTHHLQSGFVDQVRIYTGAVNGGEGVSMADWLSRLKFQERLDRECGQDAVLEAFLG